MKRVSAIVIAAMVMIETKASDDVPVFRPSSPAVPHITFLNGDPSSTSPVNPEPGIKWEAVKQQPQPQVSAPSPQPMPTVIPVHPTQPPQNQASNPLPSVTSDFTKPQSQASGDIPVFRKANDPPAPAELPILIPVLPSAPKLSPPVVESTITPAPDSPLRDSNVPPIDLIIEPIPAPKLVPIPGTPRLPDQPSNPQPNAIKPNVEPSLPAPRELPESTMRVNPIGNGVNTLRDQPQILEPMPGLVRPGVRNPRGVLGSPSIRLSRESYLHELFGLDYDHEASAQSQNHQAFIQVEYLLGWANRPAIPTLLTTNTLGQQGILGRAGTVTLLGPGDFGPSFQDGMRIRAGSWCDGNSCDQPRNGWDASFFFLGNRSQSRQFDSRDFPVLTRPFFALNTNQEAVEVVALPNVSTGSFLVQADRLIWGIDANYRHALCGTTDHTRGWMLGYRHLNMRETLTMTEFITSLGPPGNPDPAGTSVVVQDQFKTVNRFHGGQIGWFSQRQFGQLDFEWRASVAIGFTKEIVTVDGFQSRTRPNQATQQFRGGLLAVGPNLGQYTNTAFSTVPEATIRLGYSARPHLRFYVGYNFLYWSNVARPGDQIDRVLDVTFVPNPPANSTPTGQFRPAVTFKQSDLVIHSLLLGAEWHW